MRGDRSAPARRSRAKAVPHSHLNAPAYPNPATGTIWPPRGWSEVGIRNHEVRSNRAQAFLITWSAASTSSSERRDYERISPTEARMREFMQLARNPMAAAVVLQEATTAVLDMRGFARADTHPIPRPDLTGPARTPGRAGTHNGQVRPRPSGMRPA